MCCRFTTASNVSLIHRVKPLIHRVSPALLGGVDLIPGVANLTSGMRINGIEEQPMFAYYANVASAGGWNPLIGGAAGNMTLQAGAAPTFNQRSPFAQLQDESVLFNAGGFFQTAAGVFGDVTTEDLVIEGVIKQTASTVYSVNKTLGAAAAGGYGIVHLMLLRFFASDGTTGVSVFSAATVGDQWLHLLIFLRRLGFGQYYIDGELSGAAGAISSHSGNSWTSVEKLTLGANTNGTLQYDRNVAYYAAWKRDAWLDTHLQDAVAAERFHALTGGTGTIQVLGV